jgi:hypothetical protein
MSTGWDSSQHVLTIGLTQPVVVDRYDDGTWDLVFGELVIRLHGGHINEVIRQFLAEDPVIIRVEGGMADVEGGANSVPVRIRDYDVEGLPDGDTLQDDQGRRYTERVFD